MIEAKRYERVKVTMDLGRQEALDLANAIYEASGAVANWRADPGQLHLLAAKLRLVAA